ncbi:MAG: hypothetical protein LBL98_05120 [Ruminococcus sp.]|jgi:hypothetical protein|nr:hypothetical protein [Ruminococcus sp.]
MTSTEYLAELRGHLDVLPQDESEAALRFYKNEFYRSDSETSVMLRLGNPYALAKRIIAEGAEFNNSEQYKNLKKDGVTNTSQGLTEADLMPERDVLKIKTAFDRDAKPSAGYIPPPPGSGISSRKGKFKTGKFILGCLVGFFILGMTFAAAAFLDTAWAHPVDYGAVQVQMVEEPVEFTFYNENGVSEDGANFLGMPLLTQEFADTVDSININLNNTDVDIVSGDTFRVTHTEHIRLDFSGGFLNVTNGSDGGYLKIEVPETDAQSSLTLNLSNGNVGLEDIKLARLSLNISSGIITTLSNVTVTDRADISTPYSKDLSITNSFMNDTTINAPESQLNFINSTFSESFSLIASSGYQTDFSNCRFSDETLFDIKYN